MVRVHYGRQVFSVFNPRTYHRVSRRVLRNPKGWDIVEVYVAPDGNYYELLGRSNPHENNARTVGEVRKYDAQLNLLGTAKIKAGIDDYGIYALPAQGASSMMLAGSQLLVHTSRNVYEMSGPIHHEANLALAVDTNTMQVTDFPGVYVSHSFNQLTQVNSGDPVFLDHGDAYPRAVVISVVHNSLTYADNGSTTQYNVLAYGGQTGENYTGTTVNGFEVADGRALTTGVSVPHQHPVHGFTGDSGRRFRPNLYLISTDLAAGQSRFRWLTTYDPTAKRHLVSQPDLVPLGGGKFAVLYTVLPPSTSACTTPSSALRGRCSPRRTWKGKQYNAMAQPLRVGHKLLWVGANMTSRTDANGYYLYGLNVRNPATPSLLRR